MTTPDVTQVYKELIKATKHEISLAKKERKKRKDYPLSEQGREVIRQVEELGYIVIPNFYSQAKCALVVEEIKQLHVRYTDQLWVDDDDSDHRLFGANNVSPLIREYYEHPLIKEVTTYFERTPNYHGFTMAAHLAYKDGNKGSGGGWHRDRADCRQLKVLLYLTDVTEKNGPFEYFEGSHTPQAILQSVLQHGFAHNQRRFTDEAISHLDHNNLRTATGKAGTLLIADVRGIHRGMPIQAGERYSLMNYVWGHAIPKHIRGMVVKG